MNLSIYNRKANVSKATASGEQKLEHTKMKVNREKRKFKAKRKS